MTNKSYTLDNDIILGSDTLVDYGNTMSSGVFASTGNLSTITLQPDASIDPYITITTGGSSGWNYNDTLVFDDIPKDSLSVNGDANFNGDIKVKGISLVDRLENIEKRLAILRPNADLEERWEKLKELGEQYRQLEKEILDKEEICKILSK